MSSRRASADSDELSTGPHTPFARFTPNLGSHLPSAEGGCCRSLFFARVFIIGRKKPKRIVNEHLLILYAPLRHFHYALGNHFPHHARVRRPRKSTARFLNLTPRFVESCCKYSDSLRIECRFFRPNEFRISTILSPFYCRYRGHGHTLRKRRNDLGLARTPSAQLCRETIEQPRYRKKANYADCNRHQPDKR